MQFQTAQDEFLTFCAVERRLSQYTIDAYEFDLLDFRRWLAAGKEPERVTENELKGYLASMVSERALSPATVRRRIACLRAFYKRLSELEICENPLARWRPKLPRRKRLPRALTRSESAVFVNSISGPAVLRAIDEDMRTAFRLIVATGIRVGELCAIKVDDVSPEGSVIRIHGKGSRDRVAYVGDPALRRSIRTIVETRRTQRLGSLLINRIGSPAKPRSVRTKLRAFARDAGVERRVTPHMLRHTAATLLIETGVDIRFVQRLLGHASIATTEIYTHVSDEALRTTLERANVLEALMT